METTLNSRLRNHVEVEIAARLCGHMTNLLAGLLLIPASRTGILVEIFAVPYERTLKYHRFLGLMAYITVTLHALIFWIKWAMEGSLSNNVVEYNLLQMSPYHKVYMDFTITLAELAWLLITISLAMAFIFRREKYELFQYSHKYIGIIFYVTAIVHGWCFW